MSGIFDQMWSHPSWWNLLITLPWALGAGIAIHEWAVDRAVARREQTTLGTIAAHEPENHNQYAYSFAVNGKSYSGQGWPRNEDPHIGQQVTVYYDPTDPATSALTDFNDLEYDSLGIVPFAAFGVLAVAVFIHYKRRTGPTNEESGKK